MSYLNPLVFFFLLTLSPQSLSKYLSGFLFSVDNSLIYPLSSSSRFSLSSLYRVCINTCFIFLSCFLILVTQPLCIDIYPLVFCFSFLGMRVFLRDLIFCACSVHLSLTLFVHQSNSDCFSRFLSPNMLSLPWLTSLRERRRRACCGDRESNRKLVRSVRLSVRKSADQHNLSMKSVNELRLLSVEIITVLLAVRALPHCGLRTTRTQSPHAETFW